MCSGNGAVPPASGARDVVGKNEGNEEGLGMSCQEIEALLTDLARNSLVESQARDRALEHAKECSRCGARLAAERRLTEGLRAWSTASIGEQAPPRVEEKLRAAFRQQPAPARHRGRWPMLAATGAVAAAAILWIKLPAPPP